MSTRTEVKMKPYRYVALAAILLVAGGCGGVDPESGEAQYNSDEAEPVRDEESLSALSWSGRVVRIRAKHSWQCLDVQGGSYQLGARIMQHWCHDGANQKFLIEARSDGYYRFIAQHSWQCMDVQGGSYSAGASIIQHSCHDGYNQQFRIVDVGNGYYRLIARNSGMCLDVEGGSYQSGARIMQHWCHGGDNQQFWFE
jgi:hypothetical protein